MPNQIRADDPHCGVVVVVVWWCGGGGGVVVVRVYHNIPGKLSQRTSIGVDLFVSPIF